MYIQILFLQYKPGGGSDRRALLHMGKTKYSIDLCAVCNSNKKSLNLYYLLPDILAPHMMYEYGA